MRYGWITFVAYMMVIYVISPRGTEHFMLNSDRLRSNWAPQPVDHAIITLLGNIQGEHDDIVHLIHCTERKKSEINVGNIINRLIGNK